MRRTAVWQIMDAGPKKLERRAIDLEKLLEEWIEKDPELLQGGLTILGRQTPVEGGFVDLLAVDPQANWVVIEIKKGAVGPDTLAQALYYASCIAKMEYEALEEKVSRYLAQGGGENKALKDIMPAGADQDAQDRESREVRIVLVGTGCDARLESIVEYLANRCELPIEIVTFDAFVTAQGERILVRELSEVEVQEKVRRRYQTATADRIIGDAEAQGIGWPFRAIYEAAKEVGLYPRCWRWCIMYTPPTDARRCLFTTWSYPRVPGKVQTYISAATFPEFFRVTEQEVQDALGGNGWMDLGEKEVETFVSGLRSLFARIRNA